MNDAAPNEAAVPASTAEVTSVSGAPPLRLGQRLRAERERRGLSVQKAADDLHLDGWVIEALEAEDYQRVGPAVFAKGHLKKYAANLGLEVGDLLDGFAARAPGAAGGGVAAQSLGTDATGLQRAVVVGLIVAGVLAAGLWVWKPWQARGDASQLANMAAASPESATQPPLEVAQPVEAEGPAQMLNTAQQATPAEPARVAPQATNAAEATLPAQPGVVPVRAAAAMTASPATGPGAGHAQLRLSFSADSRVEVRDANGKLVFAGTGLANSVKQLAGVAPMHVFLSDAGGVQLEINDRTIAIGAKFLSGNVAHFDAGADGVLRRDTAAVAEQRPRG